MLATRPPDPTHAVAMVVFSKQGLPSKPQRRIKDSCFLLVPSVLRQLEERKEKVVRHDPLFATGRTPICRRDMADPRAWDSIAGTLIEAMAAARESTTCA